MASQEQAHLDRFDQLMAQRGVRPTALQPVWNVAGFALGAVTALMSEKAALACTDAVETEIDRHYSDQLRALGREEPDLAAEVRRFHAMLADLGAHLERGDVLTGTTPMRLLQGPFADAMTHAGQLALLRRLAGSPVPPENFIVASIDSGNLGPEQSMPVSPDRQWPEAPPGWRPP